MGSCAAFALQCGGIVSEIQLIDANQAMAEGEAAPRLPEDKDEDAPVVVELSEGPYARMDISSVSEEAGEALF